jgi:hypothetical protein
VESPEVAWEHNFVCLSAPQPFARAAADIEIVGQRDGDRVSGLSPRPGAFIGQNVFHARRSARGRHHDRVVRLDAAGGDGAGIAAEIEIQPMRACWRSHDRRRDWRAFRLDYVWLLSAPGAESRWRLAAVNAFRMFWSAESIENSIKRPQLLHEAEAPPRTRLRGSLNRKPQPPHTI